MEIGGRTLCSYGIGCVMVRLMHQLSFALADPASMTTVETIQSTTVNCIISTSVSHFAQATPSHHSYIAHTPPQIRREIALLLTVSSTGFSCDEVQTDSFSVHFVAICALNAICRSYTPASPIRSIIFCFWAHLHKAAGLEIKLSKTTTTMVYYSVSNVLWKAIAFPFWSAIDSR